MEFLSALFGASIGGLFTLWGISIQHNKQKNLKEEDLKQLKLNLLKGIKTEIELVLEIYKKRVEAHLLQHEVGTPLYLQLNVSQDNFSFYKGNVVKLAELDPNTLHQVVNFYIHAKSLIDTYNTNNKILNEIIELSLLVAGDLTNATYREFLQGYVISASEFAENVKSVHVEALNQSEVALKSINAEIHTLTIS